MHALRKHNAGSRRGAAPILTALAATVSLLAPAAPLAARNAPGSTGEGQVASRPASTRPANRAAAEPPAVKLAREPVTFRPETTAGPLWHALAAVLVVVALAVVALLLLRRWMPKLAPRAGKSISVLESVHLGPKKAVHLLQVGDRKLLVGSTSESISVLQRLSDDPRARPSFPTEADLVGSIDEGE
jgi:flagellar biosynthetic protein FliO